MSHENCESSSIVKLLRQNDYDVQWGNPEDLVLVDCEGPIRCMDGRNVDDPRDGVYPKEMSWVLNLAGPRLPGGMNAVLALVDPVKLPTAWELVRRMGHTPCTHTDDSGGGCGMYELWLRGKLQDVNSHDFVKALVLQDKKIKDMHSSNGGTHHKLTGIHQEKELRINLVSGATPIFDRDSFTIDPWFLKERFNIPSLKTVDLGLQVIKQLIPSLREAIIYCSC